VEKRNILHRREELINQSINPLIAVAPKQFFFLVGA
jgi:hypothetical protein